MSFEFEQTDAMSVTAIKEGNVLRILSDSGDIPEHVLLRLSVAALPVDAWQAAQLDSAFSDAEDWGDTLDSLLVKKDAE